MTICGAVLGPFLDSYHSAFGVLQYDFPITAQLWGSITYTTTTTGTIPTPEYHPALITAWWVPELFGLAGFIIGWLYIIWDNYFCSTPSQRNPTWPKIFLGISLFTLQYWLSGLLYATTAAAATATAATASSASTLHLLPFEQDNTMAILYIMSSIAIFGFLILDNTISGLITSVKTAFGGPLIEAFLLSTGIGNYHYYTAAAAGTGTTQLLENLFSFQYFPPWIIPVYFLGGPAVGNLARGFWHLLSTTTTTFQNDFNIDNNSDKVSQRQQLLQRQRLMQLQEGTKLVSFDADKKVSSSSSTISKQQTEQQQITLPRPGCTVCNDSRCVGCPNCDAEGYYITYGQSVKCNCCKGRGLVICRACFAYYGEDPSDIEAIREKMRRMPD